MVGLFAPPIRVADLPPVLEQYWWEIIPLALEPVRKAGDLLGHGRVHPVDLDFIGVVGREPGNVGQSPPLRIRRTELVDGDSKAGIEHRACGVDSPAARANRLREESADQELGDTRSL